MYLNKIKITKARVMYLNSFVQKSKLKHFCNICSKSNMGVLNLNFLCLLYDDEKFSFVGQVMALHSVRLEGDFVVV